MNKKILILSLIIVFSFISSASATEINETNSNTINENNYYSPINNENNIDFNQKDFQITTNKFIKTSNNPHLIFKDVSNQNEFNNDDECFEIFFDDNIKNNSNFALYYGVDNTNNKSYLIVNEIQSTSSQSNSVLSGHDVCFFYKNGKYSTYLKDEYGNPLSNERIIFNINGVGYSKITDSNGYASLNINLNPGNYSINVLFTGNNLYKSSTITNNIYIVSTILSKNLVKSYKNDSQFNAMLFDGEGNRLKNSITTFNINGVLYNRTTDKTGVAQLNINLDPGRYIITVTNNNDRLSLSYNITVLKQNVHLGYNNFIINRKGEYFVVNVTDSSKKSLSNFNVNFNVNGMSYIRTSDDNGLAKLKINFELIKDYPIYCTFSGTYQYNSFNGPVKIITRIDSSTKLNVNLNTNNTNLRDKGYSFNALLKDNNNFIMPGANIIFKINGVSYTKTTDENGIAKLNINLLNGKYSISTTYAGSNYYNSATKNNIINMNLTPNLIYNVKIPMYFNVSGLNYVNSNIYPEYIAKAGQNGIIKVYETREIIIKTTKTYGFAYGLASIAYDENHTKLSNGDNYFISKEGQKIKVNQNYKPTTQGILLKTENDFVNFYYYDTINENNINELSVAYSSIFETNFELQAITFIKNFNQWGQILYTNSIYNDDTGLRMQLTNGEINYNGIYAGNISYNQFLNGNLSILKYTNTNTPLHYATNTIGINKNPDFEYMTTVFKINNEIIKKTEKINTGILVDIQAGFNTIQTYTITDRKISNEDIKYWLNKNYTIGIEKASYGTFLNGLMTIYMSDNLANEKDNFYNLTWTRNKNTVVMSGVMNGGMSYIHVPNPSMNMILTSNNNENMKNFRFECSIMLSEMESIALRLANITSIGSLSSLTQHILGGDWFSVEQKNGLLYIDLKDYSDKLIINQTTGIASVTTEIDGFLYKGAISSDYSSCFCDGLTDNTQNNSKKIYEIYVVNNSQTNINNRFSENGNSFTITEEQWQAFEYTSGIFADFSIEASSMCISSALRYPSLAKPLLGAAAIFGLSGLGLNCLSNGVLRDPSDKNFYKSITDTSEGYVSSFTGVPLP